MLAQTSAVTPHPNDYQFCPLFAQVKFWDASAIVPLLVAEVSTRRIQACAAEDPVMLVWWGSEVAVAGSSKSCQISDAMRRLGSDADDRNGRSCR